MFIWVGFVMVKKVSILLLVAVVAITVSGCVLPCGCEDTRQADYPVELLPSRDTYVRTGACYEINGNLVIGGRVKRSVTSSLRPMTGHVDVVVVDADGEIIDIVKAPINPRDIPKKAARESRFKVELPYMPPLDSTIRLKFHQIVFLNGVERDIENCFANMSSSTLAQK